jgi:hypothetical protein
VQQRYRVLRSTCFGTTACMPDPANRWLRELWVALFATRSR